MSPNSNSSIGESSTSNKITQIYNDSKKAVKLIETSRSKIVITEHLTEPCSGFYIDIFHTTLIECHDPSHNLLSNNENKLSIDNFIHNYYSEHSSPFEPKFNKIFVRKEIE